MDPEDNGIEATMDNGMVITASDDGMVTITGADGSYTTIDTNAHTVTIEEDGGVIEHYDNTTGDVSYGVPGEDTGGGDDSGGDVGSGGWLY
jgi:hypothetical protein